MNKICLNYLFRLNTWCYRALTYIGRITVIKTLALPNLIQSLTVLPNPPEWVITEIEDIFFIISCGMGRMLKLKAQL
jgi:hypothetical protein